MNDLYIVFMSDDGDLELYETPVVYVEEPDIPLCLAFDNEGHVMDLILEEVKTQHKFLWFKWISNNKQVILKHRTPALKEVDGLSKMIVNYLTTYHHIPLNELRDLLLEELILLVKGNQ